MRLTERGGADRAWTHVQRLGPAVERALQDLARQTWGDDYWLGRPSWKAVVDRPECCCWLAFHREEGPPWRGWAFGVWLRFDVAGAPEAFEICVSPLAVSKVWAGAPTEAALRGLMSEYHLNGPTSIGPF